MRFRPSATASVLLIFLALLMSFLGLWQLDRMKAKERVSAQFESAEQLTLSQAIDRNVRFARVSATGRFDTRRHVLLDNKVLNGRPGVHVFTPFTTFAGSTVLVNRGWKAMPPDRRSLPEIWTPAVPVGIRGVLDRPPESGLKLGAADVLEAGQWPQLVTYLEMGDVATALDQRLEPWVILLDARDPAGFEGRDWNPVVLTPARHRAYAVQWFALALTAFVLWLMLGFRRGQSATADDEVK